MFLSGPNHGRGLESLPSALRAMDAASPEHWDGGHSG